MYIYIYIVSRKICTDLSLGCNISKPVGGCKSMTYFSFEAKKVGVLADYATLKLIKFGFRSEDYCM